MYRFKGKDEEVLTQERLGVIGDKVGWFAQLCCFLVSEGFNTCAQVWTCGKRLVDMC